MAQVQGPPIVEKTLEEIDTAFAEQEEEEEEDAEVAQVRTHRETAIVGSSNLTQAAHQHPTGVTRLNLLEATPPAVESTVRQVCVDESKPLRSRMNELTNRLDLCLADREEKHDTLYSLASSVAIIKAQLEKDGKRSNSPIESLTDSVRLLRNDVNALLERRNEDESVLQAPKGEEKTIQDNPAKEEDAPLWSAMLVDQEDDNSIGDERDIREKNNQKNYKKIKNTSRATSKKSSGSSRKFKSRSKKDTSRLTRYDSSSSSSSSEDGRSEKDGQSTSSSDEEEDPITFFEREKGPRHMGLKTIKPSNSSFDRLMNYRYYRLKDGRSKRSHATSQATRHFIKSMDLTFKEHRFDGSDPILVFDFLTRFVEEADILTLNEGQAFLILPHYLSGSASTQFRAMRNGARSGGITRWPELVQYFLTTYATPSAMRESIANLRSLKQKTGEDEAEFGARVNEAAYKCGNAFSEEDKMTFFVDGLHPTTQSIVARYRESQPRKQLSFEQLILHARDEGEAYRARTNNIRVVRVAKSTPASRGVHFVESTPGTSINHQSVNDDDGQLYYMANDSIATSELPSTLDASQEYDHTEAGEVQQLLYAEKNRYGNNGRTAHPLKLAHADRSSTPNRVGWATNRKNIICHVCYAKEDHIKPDCKLNIVDIEKVIINYEGLSAEEKARVPDSSYVSTKAFMGQQDARINNYAIEAKTADQSKN